MMNSRNLSSDPSDRLAPLTDQLRLAVAAYLARFQGSSGDHTESDLRCYLAWCAEHGLDPLLDGDWYWLLAAALALGVYGSRRGSGKPRLV